MKVYPDGLSEEALTDTFGSGSSAYTEWLEQQQGDLQLARDRAMRQAKTLLELGEAVASFQGIAEAVDDLIARVQVLESTLLELATVLQAQFTEEAPLAPLETPSDLVVTEQPPDSGGGR